MTPGWGRARDLGWADLGRNPGKRPRPGIIKEGETMFGKRHRDIVFEDRHEIVIGMLKMHAKIELSSKGKYYWITAITAWKERGGRRNDYRWRKRRVGYCSGKDPDIVVMRAAMRRLGEWRGRRPWPRHPWFWANILFVAVLACGKIMWLHWKNRGMFDPVGMG